MFGDFNFAGVDWSCSDMSGQALELKNILDDQFMVVTNCDPTRRGNLLDLVITNNEMTVAGTLWKRTSDSLIMV